MKDLESVIIFKRPKNIEDITFEDYAEALVEAFWKIYPSPISEIYAEPDSLDRTYPKQKFGYWNVFDEIAIWEAWTTQGNYRKIIKHAKEKDFWKVIDNLEIMDVGEISYFFVSTQRKGFRYIKERKGKENIELIILIPAEKADMPKLVSRLQLSNFPNVSKRDENKNINSDESNLFNISVNTDVEMSIPKALGAINHSAHRGLIQLLETSENNDAFIDSFEDIRFSISFESFSEFKNNLQKPFVEIHDAGHTEVVPGSVTSFAYFKNN